MTTVITRRDLYSAMDPAEGVRVVPVPPPRLPRTRRPRWELGVLRMHDVNRPQPCAGMRFPRTLVATPAGRKWGPTSRRQPRGPKPGTRSLCHLAKGDCRAARHEKVQRRRSIEQLRRLHLHLLRPRNARSIRGIEAKYERTRHQHLDRFPGDIEKLDRMEQGHLLSERH
jgi:hypothetical protein